jgi:hypothetical protein
VVFKEGTFLRAVPSPEIIYKQKTHYIFISGLLQALFLSVDILFVDIIKRFFMTPETISTLIFVGVASSLSMLKLLAKTFYYEVEERGKKGRKTRLVFGNKRLK